MSGQKTKAALALVPYEGNSKPPPEKKAKTVAPAPAPAPVAAPPPQKNPNVQPVDFEVVQMPHENVMTGTVDSIFRCAACGKISEPKIFIKKATKTFAITPNGFTYFVNYDLMNTRPACEGCSAKFKTKEVTK